MYINTYVYIYIGAVVGTLILGPIGGVFGAMGAAYATYVNCIYMY
jgi:hypothetical protein